MSQSDLFREMTRKALAAKLAAHRRKTYLAEYEARRAILRQQFNLDNDSKNAVPNNSLGLANVASQGPPPGLSQRPGHRWTASQSEKEVTSIPDSPELLDMDSCSSSDSSGSNPFDDPMDDEWEIEFDSGSKTLSEKQKKDMEDMVTGWINGEYDEQQLADAGIVMRVTNRQGKSATWP
ncbi:hypothetical protein FS837_002119 [Tulasnella sp. UAMH 9824]|nr:hypothetical protein FS837_002119 [Tulasnella sp. UAMH 9824]